MEAADLTMTLMWQALGSAPSAQQLTNTQQKHIQGGLLSLRMP